MKAFSHAMQWLPFASRIGAALLGGYAFVWGFVCLVVALTLVTGGDYDEGLMLANILAFLVYLSAFLWAFASSSLMRVWLLLAGGGAAMTLMASMLTHLLGSQS